MADLALLLLTLAWGTTFALVKGALAAASPGVFLAARFGVAAAVAGAAWAVGRARADGALLRHGAIIGLAMLAGFALQTWGLGHTTPARSGFLTGLSVLVVPFVARFWLGRPVDRRSWAGVALAVAGLALLTRPLAGAPAAVRLGDALTVACAVAFAIQIALTSEWAPLHPLAPFVAVQVGVTFAGALLLAPIGARLPGPGAAGPFAATVAFTGVAMTAGAFWVMNWAQRRVGAVRAALIYSLEPAAAAAFSWFWTGERLGPWEWAGGS